MRTSLPDSSNAYFSTRSAFGRARGIDLHFFRRQALGEAHAFFERLRDFFVIQRVAGRIDQPAPVGDGHAAPGIQQIDQLAGARPSRAAAARSARIARACARNSPRSRLLPASRLRELRRSPSSATRVS